MAGGGVSDAYEVFRYGTDTSGRAVLMNRRMAAALNATHARLDGKRPTLVQGAYMARLGGGAPDSAGYHDAGGCLDWRTWDLASLGLSPSRVIAALRQVGWAAWVRDQNHGDMDPHIHGVLLGDTDAASGASSQMTAYRNGLNGLYPSGPDYHPRPNPIPTFDYEQTEGDELQASEWDRLDALLTRKVAAGVKPLEDAFAAFRQNEVDRDTAEQDRDVASREREQAILAAVAALPDDKLTREDVRAALARVLDDGQEPTP